MPRKVLVIKTDKKQPSLSNLQNYRPSKRDYLILVVAALLLLAVYKKSWFVAATVNGQPIPTQEVNQKLNKMYKDQVLNQIINEKILMQEATKAGVSITQAELDAKVAEVEAQYGGADALNSILAQQGITRDDFIDQTRIQLIVEKLYGAEASPSAEEIAKFKEDNATAPEATDEAKFEALALEQSKQQKLSQIFSEKFQALKEAAKISIF